MTNGTVWEVTVDPEVVEREAAVAHVVAQAVAETGEVPDAARIRVLVGCPVADAEGWCLYEEEEEEVGVPEDVWEAVLPYVKLEPHTCVRREERTVWLSRRRVLAALRIVPRTCPEVTEEEETAS